MSGRSAGATDAASAAKALKDGRSHVKPTRADLPLLCLASPRFRIQKGCIRSKSSDAASAHARLLVRSLLSSSHPLPLLSTRCTLSFLSSLSCQLHQGAQDHHGAQRRFPEGASLPPCLCGLIVGWICAKLADGNSRQTATDRRRVELLGIVLLRCIPQVGPDKCFFACGPAHTRLATPWRRRSNPRFRARTRPSPTSRPSSAAWFVHASCPSCLLEALYPFAYFANARFQKQACRQTVSVARALHRALKGWPVGDPMAAPGHGLISPRLPLRDMRRPVLAEAGAWQEAGPLWQSQPTTDTMAVGVLAGQARRRQ